MIQRILLLLSEANLFSFSWSIDAGQIGIIATLLSVGWFVDSRLRQFMTEHEILIRDYCERKGIELSDLPTRFRRAK